MCRWSSTPASIAVVSRSCATPRRPCAASPGWEPTRSCWAIAWCGATCFVDVDELHVDDDSSRRSLALDRAYDLGRTLLLGDLGRSHPSLRRPSEDELLRATWTPEGPASMHLHMRAGAVEVIAWGPGRDWLLDALPRHL